MPWLEDLCLVLTLQGESVVDIIVLHNNSLYLLLVCHPEVVHRHLILVNNASGLFTSSHWYSGDARLDEVRQLGNVIRLKKIVNIC